MKDAQANAYSTGGRAGDVASGWQSPAPRAPSGQNAAMLEVGRNAPRKKGIDGLTWQVEDAPS